MSYKITVRVYQTNPSAFFQLVEKDIWNYANGGTWQVARDQHVLTMGGSGTSGTLRFVSPDTGENFVAAFGVHNYVRWCDIVHDLNNGMTALTVNSEFYGKGNYDRSYQREKQLASYSVRNDRGRLLTVTYVRSEGQDLLCNVIIG